MQGDWKCGQQGSYCRASWYCCWQESVVQGMVVLGSIGMAAVLAPPPVTHKLLSGTVENGAWTRTH